MKCSKCGSSDVKKKKYAGGEFVVCNSCGYDSSVEVDIVPESKKSQKEKGRYSPYKSRLR
jgi:DNA-directed RNA polymerase subunit M/transcription elongation factor TFIIS